MTIQLTADRQKFVRTLVESGLYASEEAVVDEALRLLQERDDEAKIARLRREVGEAIEQADRGELTPFDPLATLAAIRSQRHSGPA